MLKTSLLFFALVAVALGQNYKKGPLEPKPGKYANQPGCYISELDQVVPVGETAKSKRECLKYNCEADALSTNSCLRVSAPVLIYFCEKVIGDPSKPYPDCCDKKVCKGQGVIYHLH